MSIKSDRTKRNYKWPLQRRDLVRMRKRVKPLLLLFSTYWLFTTNWRHHRKEGGGGLKVTFSAVKGSHSITLTKVVNVFLPWFRNHYLSPQAACPLDRHYKTIQCIQTCPLQSPVLHLTFTFSGLKSWLTITQQQSPIWAQWSGAQTCVCSCVHALCLCIHLHKCVNVCRAAAKFALCNPEQPLWSGSVAHNDGYQCRTNLLNITWTHGTPLAWCPMYITKGTIICL